MKHSWFAIYMQLPIITMKIKCYSNTIHVFYLKIILFAFTKIWGKEFHLG
jgi:hypothetical protein